MPSPNPIKYVAYGATAAGTIARGNFRIGVENKEYAPTSSTDFWNGITPPTSTGYTLYQSKASDGPSIKCVSNDAEMIDMWRADYLPNTLPFPPYDSTIDGVLGWFLRYQNYAVINITDYPNVVTDGLVTLYDSGSTLCYPRGNNVIKDAGLTTNLNIYATLYNGVSFAATGGTGGSLSFDGVDDYVDIGFTSGLTSFSVDVWFYRLTNPGPSYCPLVGAFSNYLAVLNSDGRFISGFALDNNQFSTGGTSVNTWNNIVFTYNASTQDAIFYINGVYDSTTPSVTGISYGAGHVLAMRYAGDSQTFKGYMPVVKVYSKPLSAAEVTQNYNSYKVRYI